MAYYNYLLEHGQDSLDGDSEHAEENDGGEHDGAELATTPTRQLEAETRQRKLTWAMSTQASTADRGYDIGAHENTENEVLDDGGKGNHDFLNDSDLDTDDSGITCISVSQ